MKRTLLVLIGLLVALVAAVNGQTAKHANINSDGIALDGYDAVAYFKEKEAWEGKGTITVVYEGVRYRFVSEENKKQFLSSPASYLPQYGGWCAYAMGTKGEKVEVDPETFKVIDGKLYLFYNRFFNNTLDAWNKDETNLKTNADKNWSKFSSR